MRRTNSFIRRYNRELFLCFLTILLFIIFVPVFTYSYFAKDLASKESIMNKNDTGVILLDRNNHPFYTLYQAKYRNFIPLSGIPKQMQQSLIASEDKDYYKHSGFSLPSIIRALYLDIVNRDVLYGGSTITQQLVKNALLNSNRTYLRKVQEIILAQEIERRYSKNEILEMYLNSVYFGEGAFGIENASLTYFGKHVKDLTLPEAAFLTAIIPSPSRLSPFSGNLKEAENRKKIVLQKMFEQGYIEKKQKDQALQHKLEFHPLPPDMNYSATHFALMVKDQLVKKFGEEEISRSGFRVKTTLDLSWQQYAERSVAKQVEALKGNNVSNGAAVVMDPKTGDIKALVGSADWFNDKFGKMNMAIAPRSVGSSFKPIIYAAAMEKKLITPATVLKDSPTTFPGGYAPLDYDRKFRGPVLVRRALANSLNVPAVEVMQKVGMSDGLDMAKRLGITTLKDDPDQYGLSFVLGTAETKLVDLTNAYSAFANYGIRPDPRIILEIYDKQGKRIHKYEVNQKKVMEPQVAFLISSILSDNSARAEAFGNLLTIPRTAAVKTGTAEYYKDALTMGYTPSLAVGVWVGNNDNASMDSVAGSLGAAPIWKDLMEHFLTGTPNESFVRPEGVIALPICKGNGLLSGTENAASSSATEFFITGTQPTSYCTFTKPTDRFFSNQDRRDQEEDNPGRQRHDVRQKIKDRLRELRQFE